MQAVSESHAVYAHQLTERDIWQYTLNLANLRESQYLELAAFHALNGTRGAWIYTASDGGMAADCRFQDLKLSWQREARELWAVQLRFQGAALISTS